MACVLPTRLRGLSLFLLLALACSSKDPYGRLPVSGTITLRGIPIDQGMIQFLSTDANQRGPVAGAMIRDGKYAVPREQGLPPGVYRVMITSPESNNKEAPVGPPGIKMPPLGKERIPASYNRESKHTVEVKEGVENVFNFAILYSGG
jgi:hypothetical protein